MLDPYPESLIAGSRLAEAAQWAEQLLFGSLGMAIAVIAVGLMGFRMLLGYSSPREMARVLLGCFILFGAPTIARALAGGTQSSSISVLADFLNEPAFVAPPPPPSVRTPQMPPTSNNPFDPYAGGAGAK